MSIADNLKRVQDTIAEACARAGRNPAAITLVGVSKQQPPGAILEAVAAGLRHIGENRVEEGREKLPLVAAGSDCRLTWHMVGHLQSRKAKEAAALFDVVQSVDSLRLARRLSRFAGERGRGPLQILLEMNVSGEASKYGFAGYNWANDEARKDALWQALRECRALPNLKVVGLMTMAPYDAEERQIRRVFADLRELRAALQSALAAPLPVLSMGMTNDYPIAIEEGATMLRVGRAIFGERSY